MLSAAPASRALANVAATLTLWSAVAAKVAATPEAADQARALGRSARDSTHLWEGRAVMPGLVSETLDRHSAMFGKTLVPIIRPGPLSDVGRAMTALEVTRSTRDVQHVARVLHMAQDRAVASGRSTSAPAPTGASTSGRCPKRSSGRPPAVDGLGCQPTTRSPQRCARSAAT